MATATFCNFHVREKCSQQHKAFSKAWYTNALFLSPVVVTMTRIQLILLSTKQTFNSEITKYLVIYLLTTVLKQPKFAENKRGVLLGTKINKQSHNWSNINHTICIRPPPSPTTSIMATSLFTVYGKIQTTCYPQYYIQYVASLVWLI